MLNTINDKINQMTEQESIYFIQAEDGDLDVDILQIDISENAEAPTHSLDSNSEIIDNIIFLSKRVSVTCLIDYDKLSQVKEYLKSGNVSQSGFIINTISDYYSNMRYISFSYSESSDSVGSVNAVIEFVESKFVNSKTSNINYKKVPQNPQSSSKVQNGKVEPKRVESKERSQSLAKKFLG